MSKSRCSSLPFQIEGRFLAFVTKDGYKVKGLRLATSAGELYIKLSKEARAACTTLPQPGHWLQVTGEQTVDYKDGTVKFKAHRLIGVPVPQSASMVSEVPTVSMPSAQMAAPIARDATPAHRKAGQTGCILVCQKSDCCKRGGKAVKAALEAELRDRHLDDQITVRGTGCMKQCKAGPALVMPNKTRHTRVRPDDVAALLDQWTVGQAVGQAVAIAH